MQHLFVSPRYRPILPVDEGASKDRGTFFIYVYFCALVFLDTQRYRAYMFNQAFLIEVLRCDATCVYVEMSLVCMSCPFSLSLATSSRVIYLVVAFPCRAFSKKPSISCYTIPLLPSSAPLNNKPTEKNKGHNPISPTLKIALLGDGNRS